MVGPSLVELAGCGLVDCVDQGVPDTRRSAQCRNRRVKLRIQPFEIIRAGPVRGHGPAVEQTGRRQRETPVQIDTIALRRAWSVARPRRYGDWEEPDSSSTRAR